MSDGGAMGIAAAVLENLKGFQRRTAEYAFDRLYNAADSTRRFLIADEVGLGKTLVAAGVIAQAIDYLDAIHTPRIDVIYICSNQAIARQNVNRLQNYLGINSRPLAQRITLLPNRIDTLDRHINLIALTPGTSFTMESAEGVVEERIILFHMLSDAWGDLGYGAREVFRGGLRSVERFRQYEDRYPFDGVAPDIQENFRQLVGCRGEVLHQEFTQVRDQLARSPGHESRSQRVRLISKLRRLLADACLDALEPDLIVLDEFQRFRELLDGETPSAELAQRLFQYEDSHTKVRTLLLSATPYKMYTLSHETDDDHYRDFLRTVRFLQGPGGSITSLNDALHKYRFTLPRIVADGDVDADKMADLTQTRAAIQRTLLRVMTRTERRGRESGGDPMLEEIDAEVDLRESDVETFLAARELAATVNAPGVMEYWKSAPYPLSFMERYRLTHRLREVVGEDPSGAAAQTIRRSSGLQLRRRAVEERRALAGGNGRMRALLHDVSHGHLQDTLWLPPSLPVHGLGRDFVRARSATKRLVFSSWSMVPRAIAVIASYDAERRHLPDKERAEQYSVGTLRIADDAFSIFSLVTPSAALASVGDPLRYPYATPRDLFGTVRDRLRPLVDRITAGARTDGAPQRIWYAVAPLLLEEQASRVRQRIGNAAPGSASVTEQDRTEPGAWPTLVERVVHGLSDPTALGRPPRDLLDVLTALAVGSPANAALRALSSITSLPLTDELLLNQATRAGHGFRSYFRAPEAEGLLRHAYRPRLPFNAREPWRRVLAYSFEGGLSAVLEEYFYVIAEQAGAASDPEALIDALIRSIHLTTSRLNVHEWARSGSGLRERTFPLHQHFARRYASDGHAESDQQASAHLDHVRAAFNSPFWPFVLSTTSVGQEGLDFHWYCHAVVHWNLPPNPVDLEQREGRVHRFHGHAIRKNLAQAVGSATLQEARERSERGEPANVWAIAYKHADEHYLDEGGLVPHWKFTEGDARIQRHTPVLPLSRDADRILALRRSLAVYRMVFGQPRQDDLLEFILREIPDAQQGDLVSALTIDLSPPANGTID